MMYADELLPQLESLARRAAEPEGVSLAWAELKRQAGGAWAFRVFIERLDAEITLSDCERVTKRLSVLLDVEDPIDSAYVLEVSSPGLDRPLRNTSDYERFAGKLARIKTRTAVDGRKRFVGTLGGVEEDCVLFTPADEGGADPAPIRIPVANIDSARLEIDLEPRRPPSEESA